MKMRIECERNKCSIYLTFSETLNGLDLTKYDTYYYPHEKKVVIYECECGIVDEIANTLHKQIQKKMEKINDILDKRIPNDSELIALVVFIVITYGNYDELTYRTLNSLYLYTQSKIVSNENLDLELLNTIFDYLKLSIEYVEFKMNQNSKHKKIANDKSEIYIA